MFKEIVQVWNYREMLKNSVRKELRGRYKGSVLGFLWTFVNPLMQLIIYSVVFNRILKVPGSENVPDYTLWLFVALVPWTCLSATVLQSSTAIISNGNLIKKIYFPRMILPLSMTLTNFINFLLTEIIVFASVLFFRAPITAAYLALPIIFILLFVLGFAFALLLSAITVYFRDLEHIFSVFIMLWFYLSPILYDPKQLPEPLPEAVMFWYTKNPLYGIVNGIRDIMIFGRFPNMQELLYVAAFSSVMLLVALYIFNRCQRRFAEEI